MHELNDILGRGLTQPKDAIFYEISASLARALPGKYVLETDSCSFNVEYFASQGHCSIEPDKSIHCNWSTIYAPRQDTSYSSAENGLFRVVWEGHAILLLLTGVQTQYQRSKRSYVVADTREIAESFFLRVERWMQEVRGEVLVFQDGHWGKSPDLFAAIKSTSLDNLILPGRMREEVVENFCEFLDSEATYDRYNIPWKRGVIMLGPPGNGKTHMIKGLVNLLGKPCLYVRSFKSEYGTDHGNISRAFDQARASAPCLLILEDLDSLVDSRNRSFFLNEMDGFDSNRGILTVATSNHPERLDPAILDRPSRFDRKFTFGLPEEAERRRFLTARNLELEAELRLTETGLDRLAGLTMDFSYAYLKELILSSMMAWMREHGRRPMDDVAGEQVESLASQMRSVVSEEAFPPNDDSFEDELDHLPPHLHSLARRMRRY